MNPTSHRPPTQHSTLNTQHSSKRLRFIDLLRGIAMVLMITTHAADAFLADAWKHNEVWYQVNILFGFVAPAYLFFSGITLSIALRRRGEDLFQLGDGTRRLLRRSLVIVLLGYWLQVPVLSLRQIIIIQRPDELARLFNSNVLQVIGLTLIAITLAAWLLGSLRRAAISAVILSVVIVGITPLVLQSELYLSLPLPFRYYFAPQPPAVFALVPHAAYVLLGFAMAGLIVDVNPRRYAVRRRERRARLDPALKHGVNERSAGESSDSMATHGVERDRDSAIEGRITMSRWLLLTLIGCGLMLCSYLLDLLLTIPPYNTFWGPTPQQFLFRTGGLLIATRLIVFLMRWVAVRHTRRLEFAGRRSLAIYVIHLMLIYGSAMNMGVRYWLHGALNNTLTPSGTLLMTVAIIAVTYVAVRFWEWLRVSYPTAALWSKRLWWGTFWGFFLLEP